MPSFCEATKLEYFRLIIYLFLVKLQRKKPVYTERKYSLKLAGASFEAFWHDLMLNIVVYTIIF